MVVRAALRGPARGAPHGGSIFSPARARTPLSGTSETHGAAIADNAELVTQTTKAPQVGLEPTTLRLTAGCSAIELLRSVVVRDSYSSYHRAAPDEILPRERSIL